jgi:copper chaperone CopZ
MERLQVSVPGMYADHHVLRVRADLSALNGIQDVVASAAFRSVALRYDPALISVEAIKDTLAAAGYPVEQEPRAPVSGFPVATRRGDPAWDRLDIRIARTDARDAKANR